jgi:hypothetical protein
MSDNGQIWGHVRIDFVASGWMTLAGLSLAGAVLLLGLRSWPYELIHHFVLHYFLLSSFLMIAFLLMRRRIAASCSAILLTVFAVFLWGVYGDSESYAPWAETSSNYPPDSHQLLTVITLNVRDTETSERLPGTN